MGVSKQDVWRRHESEIHRSEESTTIGILPDYRDLVDSTTGQKVSYLLFESCLSWFRKKGLRSVRLLCQKENARAKRFYLSLGGVIDSRGCYLADSDLFVFDLRERNSAMRESRQY